MSTPSPSLASQRAALERALAPVKLRVRMVRALRALVLFVLFGAALVVIASAMHALGMVGIDRSHALLGGAFIALWGLALGWSRAPSTMEAAQLVDRSHATHGRIAAAVALLDEGASGPMSALAIEDAGEHAQRIEANRTIAFTAPRFLRPAMLAALVAAIASLLGPPTNEVAAATPITTRLRPITLHDDDLASLREHVTSLPERHRSPEVRAEIEALNTLLEELSGHEVERAEALRRLGEIADGLREARPGALDATLEALAPMTRPLSRSALTESIGEALRDGDLATAAREMERLSERLEREPPSRAELERLREAMASAASAMDTETLRREREALEEQRDRLLHRDEEESAMSESERTSRDERRERELERLRRDIEERTERERELEELRRELAEALDERSPESAESESGESESGESESGESEMEQAAEDMQRFADEQSAEEERAALEREVEAMRELVRRMREGNSGEGGTGGSGSETESPGSSEGGGEGTTRMDRFVLRARGEGEEGGGEGTPIGVPGERGGEPGEGEAEGSEGEGGEGERSASAPGAGGESGEGEGEGGGESREMLMLGAGGDARLELPGMGSRGRGDEGPGSGEGAPESPGEGHGSGSSGDTTDPTGRGGEHTTVRVAGEEGRGPTRSEVIRTSAARGFASREYRDVYGDYRSHAEEALEDEEIPPGYRFYVERYFQLIRPREE